jgi:hypothetical protein
VQKYFIRLAQAGLPIPGRTPNVKYTISTRSQKSYRRYRKQRNHASSTLKMNGIRVVSHPFAHLDDDDDHSKDDTAQDSDIDEGMKQTEEYKAR